MHAYLLLGGTIQEQNAQLSTLCKKHAIPPSSQLSINNSDSKPSIGIDEIRKLIANLWIQSTNNTPKAAIIRNAHTLTPEAQNALLKNLEEPPGSTIFILLAPSASMLLETIVSRCVIIPFATTTRQSSLLNNDELFQSLSNPSVSIGTCIKKMETSISSRDDALLWYENVCQMLPKLIENHPEHPYYTQIASLMPLVKNAFDRNVSWKTIVTTLIIQTKSHPLDKPEENCVQ